MLLGVPQISRIVSLPDAGSEGVVSRERAERLERTSGETEPYGNGDNGKGGVNGGPTALKLRVLGKSGLGQKRTSTRARKEEEK